MPQLRQWYRLFKLHGSVNWFKCPGCGRIIARPPSLIGRTLRPVWSPNGTQCEAFPIEFEPATCCDEMIGDSATPMIVPPSWDKKEYRSGLGRVWESAARVLSKASSIVICGYSLPESDSFFRYLFALGSVGETLIHKFNVFDPDPAVEARFQALLGPGAKQRFRYHCAGFEDCLSMLEGKPTALLSRG